MTRVSRGPFLRRLTHTAALRWIRILDEDRGSPVPARKRFDIDRGLHKDELSASETNPENQSYRGGAIFHSRGASLVFLV